MPGGQREQLMLDAAGHVSARGGYHSASMEEVVTEPAVVSKPLPYAYFDSRDGHVNRTGRSCSTGWPRPHGPAGSDQ